MDRFSFRACTMCWDSDTAGDVLCLPERRRIRTLCLPRTLSAQTSYNSPDSLPEILESHRPDVKRGIRDGGP